MPKMTIWQIKAKTLKYQKQSSVTPGEKIKTVPASQNKFRYFELIVVLIEKQVLNL